MHVDDKSTTEETVHNEISIDPTTNDTFSQQTLPVIKKFTLSKWISSLMIVWSAAICCMAAVSNFGELVVTRLFLGVAESGFVPGAFFLLSMWYKSSQLAVKFAIFYSGNALSGAFGGLLAYFITGYMHGKGGLEGWRWLLLLEGLSTLVLALVSLDYWVTCLRKDDDTLSDLQHNAKFNLHSLYLTLKDLRVYIALSIGLFSGTAINSIVLYLSTLRSWMIYYLLGLAAFKPIKFAWFSGVFAKPHDKRAIFQAMLFVVTDISGVLSSMLYQKNDEPKYCK
ncbi:3981_t:CDS:2 [Racocetra persica]|uniref:3981_t:CDS:1 n=1 Tax=Racocetra persica TaxID=160502 RepID=A0ACA9KHC9_9GLOM|nr:3981_t:CDS:2 [Racocetra persica]